MSVFASREAAEECATGDSFVVNGVVRSWTLCEWGRGVPSLSFFLLQTALFREVVERRRGRRGKVRGCQTP